ncbi:MAG TPA: SDR family oxidoreductase [Terriglobia bacterium]|nr:SDR family oxidoreductase [Terriglobia bacterium]
MSLRNRTALVTGASRGIGKEIAMVLAREGARMAVSYRINKHAAERVVGVMRSLRTEALALAADVTDPAQVKKLVDSVVQHYGRLDILVNNVGDFQWKTAVESSPDEWLGVVASNLFSAFYASKHAIPAMRRQRWGRIINLGSAGAERAFGQAKISAYLAAKAGVVALSRSLALEEAKNGITVNVVNPAIIDDPDLSLEEARRVPDARFPVGRPATSWDVAQAVKFFASEDSSFITGQVLNVTGGWML